MSGYVELLNRSWGLIMKLIFQVDRELVLSKGRDAVGKLLVDLQVRKSTADSVGAREFYLNLTKPRSGWEGEIRDIVLKKKLVRITIFLTTDFFHPLYQPRKIFIQPNTVLIDGEVQLKEYPPTCEGVIQSFIERRL